MSKDELEKFFIIAAAAWPWAAHYYSQFSGLFGLVLRVYALGTFFHQSLSNSLLVFLEVVAKREAAVTDGPSQ
jgi:hypothetical protein